MGGVMRYFRFEFEWHTRPMFRKGRDRKCAAVFAAANYEDALFLAIQEGKSRFPRHKWKLSICTELTAPELTAPGKIVSVDFIPGVGG
jgi:hypothetical protein